MNKQPQAHALLHAFFTEENIPQSAWPTLSYINEDELPHEVAFLLTQTLLTPQMAEYHQRTPQIRAPLHVNDDIKNNYYARSVLMVIDNNKNRDDALLADRSDESTVVELGLITVNFSALPQEMSVKVRLGQTPFGTLLMRYKIKTHRVHPRYFKISCNQSLLKYLDCGSEEILYGRTHTLVRDDNHMWVAHVLDILAMPRQYPLISASL